MESFVIRIRAYYKGDCIRCGTGIVINNREVLTATHVVCGDQHTIVVAEGKEIPLSKVRANDVATVLRTEQPLMYEVANIFSFNEILDTHTLWTVNGYITEEQCEHQMTGRSIVYDETHDAIWDYYLTTIKSGQSNNYEGLSGSPVISRERIVGVLQSQVSNGNGSLGVRMASVGLFRELLPADNLKPNKYEMLSLSESQAFSCCRVEENKKSRKYIPNIFVEEKSYKEQLRYFSDPYLFVKKAIHDFKRIDFSAINRYLIAIARPEMNFSGLPDEFSPDELETVTIMILHSLSYAIDMLKMSSERGEKIDVSIERYFNDKSVFNNSLRHYLENLRMLVEFAGLRYLLLTKRAGQGKTNLLCDFTENFLLKKGYCVWYFNAYELREDPLNVLWRRLSIHGEYDPTYAGQVLEHAWKRTGRPVVVVIDGLNENTAIPDFGDCIYDFLEKCGALPYLKVIMTTRKELLEERFDRLLRESEKTTFRHIDMESSDDEFKERIFGGYLHFFDVEIRWQTLMRRTFSILTNDVLLLRFFCEVNEHKRQLYMYDVYKYAVFEQYLVKKAQEYQRQFKDVVDSKELFYSLLDHICEHMINNKEYFNVPLSAFDLNQQKLLKQMLENDVIFKGEELIENGILERNSVVISFTFDEFRDFCLTNYLLSHYFRCEDFLNFWKPMQEENQTIREGVQKYIFYLSKTKYRNKLQWLVKRLPEYKSLYWEFIWDVEDQYITKEDMALWKEQMLHGSQYTVKIVENLVFKYDCTFFTGANIKLLFEVLDELVNKIDRYSWFVETMFGITKKDKYGRTQHEEQTVIHVDDLLEGLSEQLKDAEWDRMHRELFHLVIYLYELAMPQAQAVWNALYQVSPETAVELLREISGNEGCLIKGNVKDILLGLLENQRGDEYDLEIGRLNEENNFGHGMMDTAQSIARIFGGGS